MVNNAAYIESWLEVFKGDTRILIKAASRVEKMIPVDEPELEMELEEA